ncbi:MarR family transcriptional regulator [Lichenibacterium minor]|jgi:DNA-binding MarR family transcriptional regulator|uniref:MarR family transcriptional regulator n=1 Tax=Lichenibacterium minor TaxID=2316528 RepID=A0A4V1RU51_9HYPH|nr:MarR family winged helix-turn-helix transcriptional regulator [Lichenibacterium minor]RYC29934.1 MarR family transcriptional regulator [Lichenibacterium minor]
MGAMTEKADAVPSAARRSRKVPKTADTLDIDFDIFGTLLSFYVRTVNILVSQDLDARMERLLLAGGTGKIATLLLVGANPGIRPSVLAHVIRKDRSAMGKLLDAMGGAELVEQRVSPAERRARELYLLPKGEALRARVRDVALTQDRDFFSVLDGGERAQLLGLLRKVYGRHLDGVPDAG